MILTSKEKQALKARAHTLSPCVTVGMKGISDAVSNEINLALKAHELIKIKVHGIEKSEQAAVMSELSQSLRAQVIQHIGHIWVFYRKNPLR